MTKAINVEVEEDITEDTKILGVQEVYLDKSLGELNVEKYPRQERKTIREILEVQDCFIECRQIYARFNGKLQLIWEAE